MEKAGCGDALDARAMYVHKVASRGQGRWQNSSKVRIVPEK